MMRIGMLTSGGDCQALNAAMRGVVKCIANSGEEVEFYGFLATKGLYTAIFVCLLPGIFRAYLQKEEQYSEVRELLLKLSRILMRTDLIKSRQ